MQNTASVLLGLDGTVVKAHGDLMRVLFCDSTS